MATQVQFRRGTTADISTFIGADGEIVVDTTKKTCVVNDGVQVAGYPLLREDGSNSALSVGSLSSCALKFANDFNTGIISPGSDQIALVTAGASRLSIDSAGSVTIPGNLLVSGSITGSITFDNGSAAVPALRFTNDPDTGVYLAGTNQLAISTNGTGRLFVDSSGRVGVGASTLGALLDVAGGNSIRLRASAASISLPTGLALTTGFGVSYLSSYDGSGNAVDLNGTSSNFIWSADTHRFTNRPATTEYARIDSSGRVGIGTSSPGAELNIVKNLSGGLGAQLIVENQFGNAGSEAAILCRTNVSCKAGLHVVADDGGTGTGNGNYLYFTTTPGGSTTETTRMTITRSGNVGINTTSPGQTLSINAGANQALGIWNRASDNVYGGIHFKTSDGATGQSEILNERAGTNGAGLLFYTKADGGSASERARIDSSGRVGIGTTSPAGLIHGRAAAGAVGLLLDGNTGDSNTSPPVIDFRGNAGTGQGARIAAINTGAGYGRLDLAFFTSNTGSDTYTPAERARIDSSGRLLVGASSTSANTTLLLQGYNGTQTNSGGHLRLAIPTTTPAIDANLGTVLFSDSAHTNCAIFSADRDGGTWSSSSKPTRLVFSTTADGASSPTERMRISNDGGTYWRSTGTSSTHDLGNNNASFVGDAVTISTYRNTTNSTYNLLTCVRQGFAIALYIRDSGNVENANNSYTGISDVKLKEKIVDANSQWTDIKALKVRNYNFKEETGHSTHRQIGLIAQEVEVVCPGLVDEAPDRDFDGNDLGTVTKSVNYSVLYMKAVKALQEAMERIETLEAKVAALESA